jgi:hypothetical protein
LAIVDIFEPFSETGIRFPTIGFATGDALNLGIPFG